MYDRPSSAWPVVGSTVPPERRCPFCNAPEGALRRRGDERRCLECGRYWLENDEPSIRMMLDLVTRPAPEPEAVHAVNEAASRPADTDDDGWHRLTK